MTIGALRSIGDHRWFAIADLVLVLAAIILWSTGLSWQPLVIVLIPPVLRLAAGRSPFMPTLFDIPVALFLISAVIGLWVSYVGQDAWTRFWFLVAAAALYYALAGQPKRNHWPLAAALGLSGVGIGVYFLLTHDWGLFPAKISPVNSVLVRWSEVRPPLNLPPLPPNVAAGLMAITMPFLSAWGINGWRQRQRWVALIALIASLVVGGLIFTSTSAWVALCAAAGTTGLIWLGRRIAPRASKSYAVVITVLLIFALFLLVVGILVFPEGTIDLAYNLPGSADASGRLELSRQTLGLIADFPITGGGLGSFPGLYSQYILVIPFFFIPNAHNIFLDVTLEQGFIGAVALLVIFGGSYILMLRNGAFKKRLDLLQLAIGAGLVVMMVQGLVEDTVYGSPALPFLLALPGLAVAYTIAHEQAGSAVSDPAVIQVAGLTLLILAAIAVGWLVISRQTPRSIWLANQGALQMAGAELKGWPSGKWVEDFNLAELQPATTSFERALEGSENRTAYYRLGLIAMLGREYEEAVHYLEKADRLGGYHRGIRKNLAYSYVWTGRFEEARPLLSEIDEAYQELSVYNWWWETQNQPELASRAILMASRLESTPERGEQ